MHNGRRRECVHRIVSKVTAQTYSAGGRRKHANARERDGVRLHEQDAALSKSFADKVQSWHITTCSVLSSRAPVATRDLNCMRAPFLCASALMETWSSSIEVSPLSGLRKNSSKLASGCSCWQWQGRLTTQWATLL